MLDHLKNARVLALATVAVLCGCFDKTIPPEAKFCGDILGSEFWERNQGIPTIVGFTGPAATELPNVKRVTVSYKLKDGTTDLGTCDVVPFKDNFLLQGHQLTQESHYLLNTGPSTNIAEVVKDGNWATWRVVGYEEIDPRFPGMPHL